MSTEHTFHHSLLQTRITGTIDASGKVARYRGIQYADVDQRWTRSSLRTSYPQTVDARKFGPRCPQPDEPNHTADFGPCLPFEHDGEDDLNCLNLNITAPVDLDGSIPVFFWIHGGSLLFGAGSDPIWEPTRLVEESIRIGKPIIVVTIKVVRFSYTANTKVSRGNFGFHDQVVALEWVQRYIVGFGGDPRKVTIGGESAGGCSVHALINYQEKLGSQRYFHRAIMQSGNMGVMGFRDRQRTEQLWTRAVAEIGIAGTGDSLEMMRRVSWERLLQVDCLQINGYGVYQDNLFLSPPLFSSDGDFLPNSPQTVDAIMHGDNADEGNIFRPDACVPGIMESVVKVATSVLGAEGTKELLNTYGLDDDGLDQKQVGYRLHRFPEDARFYLPSDRVVSVWPKAAFYHLDVKSPLSSSLWPGDCFHTLDLLYLFGCFDASLEQEGLDDHLRLGKVIQSTWVDFIYSLDPWEGALQGRSATFTADGTLFGPADHARRWDKDRKDRMERLKRLDFVKIVNVATRTFP